MPDLLTLQVNVLLSIDLVLRRTRRLARLAVDRALRPRPLKLDGGVGTPGTIGNSSRPFLSGDRALSGGGFWNFILSPFYRGRS